MLGGNMCEGNDEDGLGAVYLIGKIKRVFALRSLSVYKKLYETRWYRANNVLCEGVFIF